MLFLFSFKHLVAQQGNSLVVQPVLYDNFNGFQYTKVGSVWKYFVPGMNKTTIDVSAFPQGIYTVALVCDGEVRDAKQVVIE